MKMNEDQSCVINSFQHRIQRGKTSLHHCFKVDQQIYSSWIISHIRAGAQHRLQKIQVHQHQHQLQAHQIHRLNLISKASA